MSFRVKLVLIGVSLVFTGFIFFYHNFSPLADSIPDNSSTKTWFKFGSYEVDLYQEIILDHGKNPRNLRRTDNFNKDAKGHNPLCGDKVHVFLKLNENKKIEDISFEGSGCAISMASASIMTDLVKEKEEEEAKKLIKDFLDMIKEKSNLTSNILDDDQKTKLMSLSGVKKYPMRVKCATLAWHTLTSAITNTQEEINTEKFD